MKWTIHFKDSYLVEGVLDWSKVSTTSVERPEAMSCAPSGATPTVSTTPHGGERTNPHLRGRRSRWVGISHAESYTRTPLSRAIGGEGVQTKPLACLYHGIQPQWNWMSPREPEGTIVRSFEMQTSPPGLDQTSSKSAPSPRCGSSIDCPH